MKESVPSEFEDEDNIQVPSFYTGTIPPSPDGTPRDTFLKLPGKQISTLQYLFLNFPFYRSIGKSERGFEKLSSGTAVLHARV